MKTLTQEAKFILTIKGRAVITYGPAKFLFKMMRMFVLLSKNKQSASSIAGITGFSEETIQGMAKDFLKGDIMRSKGWAFLVSKRPELTQFDYSNIIDIVKVIVIMLDYKDGITINQLANELNMSEDVVAHILMAMVDEELVISR